MTWSLLFAPADDDDYTDDDCNDNDQAIDNAWEAFPATKETDGCNPFRCSSQALKETIALPSNSVYGLGMVGMSLTSGWSAKNVLLVFGVVWSSLLLNYVIQCIFIYFLYHFVAEKRKTGDYMCLTPWLLRHVCLATFAFSTYRDFSETMNMVRWLCLVKTTGSFEELDIGVNEQSGEPEMVSGMTLSMKFFHFLFVILPKLGLAVALLLAGFAFLATSDTVEDLLLNTLAVNYILETDELLFFVLNHEFVISAIEKVPPFKIESQSIMKWIWIHHGNIIKIVGVLLVVTSADKYICEKLPMYA